MKLDSILVDALVDKVLHFMGQGLVLGIPFDPNGGNCILVNPREIVPTITVPLFIVYRILTSNDHINILHRICRITKYKNNQKMGWEELHLDGENYDFYSMVM